VSAQSAALSIESSLLTVRNRQPAALNQWLKNLVGRWQRSGQEKGSVPDKLDSQK